MSKQTILTGIRANNDLHIGNYFGAMMPIIDMAKQRSNEFNVNLFIPDLHSFTTPIDHGSLYDSIMHNARVFAAAGLPLDNDSIHLYRQSYVPAHSELTWILDCFTGFGEMNRMTQFKDKSIIDDEVGEELLKKFEKKVKYFFNSERFDTVEASQDPDSLTEYKDEIVNLLKTSANRDFASHNIGTVGLFNYPVLMAADILMYGAKYIPVGEDQTQHLEFTRDIAERMNNRFGELFVVPEPVQKQHEFFGNDQGLRIKDLVDPSKKMSKSDDTGKGVIFLSDDPEAATKKVMSATTDDKASVNYDKLEQPGISNLLEILTLLRQANASDAANDITLETTVSEFQGFERYGEFKRVVANEVKTFLTNFQAKLASVDDEQVLAKLESSEAAMNNVANQTLLRVQRAVGLRKKD